MSDEPTGWARCPYCDTILAACEESDLGMCHNCYGRLKLAGIRIAPEPQGARNDN